MSTLTIFFFAVVVFGLMATGIVLTMLEFRQLIEESEADEQVDDKAARPNVSSMSEHKKKHRAA